MNTISDFIQSLLGLGVDPKYMTSLQVSLRGIIIFLAALLMMRISSKRSLAQKTPFDTALMVVIASVLARAVNGSAPLVPTVVVGFVLVVLHRLFAVGGYVSHRFGILIKGRPAVVVEKGEFDRRNMRFNQISEHDIQEDMRLKAATEDLSQIKVARVERSGDISFVKAK